MIKLAVAGLGKMGLSHQAIIGAHPGVEVRAVCDSTSYLLDVLNKYTRVPVYTNFEQMLDEVDLDAVIIATPSSLHAPMVRAALSRGLHVFCEKPFTLSASEGKELVELARTKGVANQVGYHYRFVGAFQEVKRLLDLGLIGDVSSILAEAYGPVVLRPKGSTWRTQRTAGGGCLFDYAAHPINLVNWYMGMPIGVGGSALTPVFSRETDDEVSSTLYFEGGRTAQISVNWSDESYRKMSTKVSIRGTHGRITADRQEVQLYLRDTAPVPPGFQTGWNVRYTTELTDEVWYYVRGEEYSAQLDYFIKSIESASKENINSFAQALMTDEVMEMITADANGQPATRNGRYEQPKKEEKKGFFSFLTR